MATGMIKQKAVWRVLWIKSASYPTFNRIFMEIRFIDIGARYSIHFMPLLVYIGGKFSGTNVPVNTFGSIAIS